jgi:hypothetical protein
MTRYLKFFLASLLLSVLTAAAESARADELLGGTGGVYIAPVNCPAGMVVVGLAGRAGAVIDTMQLICGKANADYGVLVPTRIGPSNGGGQVSVRCPPLSAAFAIQINAKPWRGHVAVSQITLTCGLKGGHEAENRLVFGADDGVHSKDAGNTPCGVLDFIGGFTGRSGTWIDALGTTCLPESVMN